MAANIMDRGCFLSLSGHVAVMLRRAKNFQFVLQINVKVATKSKNYADNHDHVYYTLCGRAVRGVYGAGK